MSEKMTEFFLPYMPHIFNYREEFDSLNRLLGKTTLTGKISSLSIAENLFHYMEETKEKFNELQNQLIDVLVEENVNKTNGELMALAQVTIDILIRNLFERTADVGFLATDTDIRRFLSLEEIEEKDRAFMKNRLEEYVKKYSVYDEIILFDSEGKVKFNLDGSNELANVTDPLVQETLVTDQDYIETFRPSPLQKKKLTTLIYSAPIKDAAGEKVLGVLCLCFKIRDEMDRIFSTLTQGHDQTFLALLDKEMNVITNSKEELFRDIVKFPKLTELQVYKHRSSSYMTATAETNGYQGYFGSGWQGAGMVSMREFAKHSKDEDHSNADYIHEESALMDQALKHIIDESENLLEDLGDVVINGEIIASKKRSYELNPVLDNVRTISNKINDLSVNSIKDLLSTVFQSYMERIKFYSSLAVDIMDRNLYERANDCRWWALTSDFRQILNQPEITSDDIVKLESILQYINSLYTVYTNLFIFDKNGQVIAVSNQNEKNIIGNRIKDEVKSKVMANTNTQKYFVSGFEKTKYYSNRHTYIYYATILSMEKNPSPIGGIGIVFDSEPEFLAMLEDSLPKNKNNETISKTYGFFLDKERRIVSTTNPKYNVGDVLDVDENILKNAENHGNSHIIEGEENSLLIGCRKSFGYREYKTQDGYVNDIYSVMMMEI